MGSKWKKGILYCIKSFVNASKLFHGGIFKWGNGKISM